MPCRVPSARHRTPPRARRRTLRRAPDGPPDRPSRRAGYPAGVSAEAKSPRGTDPGGTPEGPRPGRLTAAAALTGLEGAALVAGGLYVSVRGLTGDGSAGQALTAGVTLVALAVLPLVAAKGLLARRGWSRGPAIMTQIISLPVAWTLLQADSMLIPGGIALGVAAVTTLVLLVNPATTVALDIRGPGRADQ